ncbi:LytR/AlgR family response regulator transcription factor [Ekhidna sp. To15]|uniref:LytR/AlgR family response regulator transcription factor n=1 Tax=Ekhidna sp. To15 TaxID=3395267 RepID=UPI003F5232AD
MSNPKYTCLIVEDDPAFAEILKVVVGKVSEVELLGVCDNTLDAAKRIDLDKPDVLLLDINISGLEGPEILELSDHKPKTVVITSHPEEVMENYDVEYTTFIQKPLKNSDQLVNAIHKCLKLMSH